MKASDYVLALLVLGVLTLPFIFRGVTTTSPGVVVRSGPADQLVIMTPHLETVRRKFNRAFSEWYVHKYHRAVNIEYLIYGGGDPSFGGLLWRDRRWNGSQAYADSKLFDVVLAFAVAHRWPHVLSNALEPGWVPTKMGGPNAPDDMAQAPETQVWLAVSDDLRATVTGRYFYHKSLRDTHPAASDIQVQDGLLRACEEFTGVTLASANSRSESSR